MATYTMEQFEKKLKNFGRKHPDLLKAALRQGTETVRTEMIRKHLSGPKMAVGKGSRTNATLKRHTGDLAGSINTKVRVTKTKQTGSIGTNLVYARIHELGGTIKPKNGKFLVFKIGANTVFAKSVTIPARPYAKPSLAAKRKEVIDDILKVMIRGYKKA